MVQFFWCQYRFIIGKILCFSHTLDIAPVGPQEAQKNGKKTNKEPQTKVEKVSRKRKDQEESQQVSKLPKTSVAENPDQMDTIPMLSDSQVPGDTYEESQPVDLEGTPKESQEVADVPAAKACVGDG